jgi:hypothetical protein
MRKGSKHHHYAVTITYPDGEEFQRVYIDRKKAEAFAERQKKSPAVKGVRITELQWKAKDEKG